MVTVTAFVTMSVNVAHAGQYHLGLGQVTVEL